MTLKRCRVQFNHLRSPIESIDDLSNVPEEDDSDEKEVDEVLLEYALALDTTV